ncbi:EAL domain-containing protein [Parasphingorhabdus sp.]|uniref:EAL domain-containing protein n=1 Tax=Parasphingorhabdus sp. TaxID=2709688 RepID=UPI003592F960
MNAFRRILLAWALALAAAIAFAMSGVGSQVDQRLQNFRANLLEKPASGQVVIVEIDAKSLQAMDSWPWPREFYAQAIERLNQFGVTQIAFDIDFSAHSTKRQDQIFAEAISRSEATVILPTFRQLASSEQSQYTESLPIESLRKNAFLASVNVRPDDWGQLNQYSFGTRTADTARPSLASMMAEISGNIDENFAIDQTIDPATIPRVSFVDIVRGDRLIPELAGKKALIGATAIELGDRYPISRFGVVPGVVIQAMATETLLQGTDMASLGTAPPLVLAAIMLMLCILIRKSHDQALVRPAYAIAFVLVVLIFLFEYLHFFTFSNVPAFFFLGTFLILQNFLATALALKTSRFFNDISNLPNETAMLELIGGRKSLNIATASIAEYHELLVVTNNATRSDLFGNIADRLKFLALGEQVFHLDSDIMGWIVKEEYDQDIAGHFDTAAALLQSPVMAGDTRIKINATFGISSKSIRRSKVAAEQAFTAGVKWTWYDEEAYNSVGLKQNLLVELEQAIQKRHLDVVYQPKWDLAKDRLAGAEALVRWSHPEQGLISPAIFIPILEKSGRIDELTYFVLQRTLKDLATWDQQCGGLSCSVNISARLLGDAKFVENAIAMVEASDIENEQVIFEVTETAALADPELSRLALDRIRDAGIRISIDDYGTGQSTMSYLQRMPVNEIKIDQSFVKTMTFDNANRVMVKSTIEMAHALGFKVVAEGIEDQQCMNVLIKYGCDVGQGWHISKPVDSKVFEREWLGAKIIEAQKFA